GAGGVAAGDVRQHFPASRLFPLKLRRQAAALEQGQIGRRTVGGIGPHLTGRVVAIEHRAELAALMCRRVGDSVAPQKAVLAVNADMVLVAEHRHRDLDLAFVAFLWRDLSLAPALDRRRGRSGAAPASNRLVYRFL